MSLKAETYGIPQFCPIRHGNAKQNACSRRKLVNHFENVSAHFQLREGECLFLWNPGCYYLQTRPTPARPPARRE